MPGDTDMPSYVVGVGNPYRRDDGIGIHVAQALRRLNLGDDVIVMERQMIDISLLAESQGASRIVIIDALRAGSMPGRVVRISPTEDHTVLLELPLSHEPRLYDLVETAKQSGLHLCPIVVVGVEPEDCGAGEGLSRAVAEAMPLAIQAVLGELRREGVASDSRFPSREQNGLLRP